MLALGEGPRAAPSTSYVGGIAELLVYTTCREV